MKIHQSIVACLLLQSAQAFSPLIPSKSSSLLTLSPNGRQYKIPSTTGLHVIGRTSSSTTSSTTTTSQSKSNIIPPSTKQSTLTTAEVTSTTDIINPFNDVATQTEKSSSTSSFTNNDEYKFGITIIGFITLMFSSNSPVLHAAFVNSSNPPSVLLLNAATSSIALMGLILFGPILNAVIPLPSALQGDENDQNSDNNDNGRIESNNKNIINPSHLIAGTELGFWKTLGTTANLYGLSFTSANHAAFLIQLTTLIVPSVQGLMGVPVPQRIWTSIALALCGIFLFTQDMAASSDVLSATNTMILGDALCVVAAGFYATYDLRLFSYGKKVPPLPLIRTKIAIQACLSIVMLAVLGEQDGLNEITSYIGNLLSSSSSDLTLVGSAVLWSGLVINALVPFLQVSGQQIVGASRAQVVYASQPLWAAILSFVLLGETLGEKGMMGGFLFLSAIFLAASADSPDSNCEEDVCEV